MYDFLDNLRMRPVAQKKQIALMTSGGITALIALVWVSVVLTSPNLSVNIPASSQEASAMSAFGESNSMIEVLDEAGDMFGEAKSIVNEGPPRPESTATDAWGTYESEYGASYPTEESGDTTQDLTFPINKESYEASVQNPYGSKSTTKSPSVNQNSTGGTYSRPSRADEL